MYLGFLTYDQLSISFCLTLIGIQREEKGIPKSLKGSSPRGGLRVYLRLSNRQKSTKMEMWWNCGSLSVTQLLIRVFTPKLGEQLLIHSIKLGLSRGVTPTLQSALASVPRGIVDAAGSPFPAAAGPAKIHGIYSFFLYVRSSQRLVHWRPWIKVCIRAVIFKSVLLMCSTQSF